MTVAITTRSRLTKTTATNIRARLCASFTLVFLLTTFFLRFRTESVPNGNLLLSLRILSVRLSVSHRGGSIQRDFTLLAKRCTFKGKACMARGGVLWAVDDDDS